MRSSFALAVAAAFTLTACPERQSLPSSVPSTEDAGSSASTRLPSKPTVHAATPVAPPEDAGAAAAAGTTKTADPANTADAGEDAARKGKLEKFTGFSRDESQYAYATWSDGAGFFLLQIVEGKEGKLRQRFVLDSPESEAKARAALEAGGFTSAQGALPGGVTVDAAVAGGKVIVTQRSGQGPAKILYSDDPFGGQGGPATAKVGQVSPSGRRVAVRVEQKPVTEFGGIVTYLLLDVGDGK